MSAGALAALVSAAESVAAAVSGAGLVSVYDRGGGAAA